MNGFELAAIITSVGVVTAGLIKAGVAVARLVIQIRSRASKNNAAAKETTSPVRLKGLEQVRLLAPREKAEPHSKVVE
jgi:hypothetical protein